MFGCDDLGLAIPVYSGQYGRFFCCLLSENWETWSYHETIFDVCKLFIRKNHLSIHQTEKILLLHLGEQYQWIFARKDRLFSGMLCNSKTITVLLMLIVTPWALPTAKASYWSGGNHGCLSPGSGLVRFRCGTEPSRQGRTRHWTNDLFLTGGSWILHSPHWRARAVLCFDTICNTTGFTHSKS